MDPGARAAVIIAIIIVVLWWFKPLCALKAMRARGGNLSLKSILSRHMGAGNIESPENENAESREQDINKLKPIPKM